MEARPKLAAEQVERIIMNVRKRQLSIGYPGSYREWIAKVTPSDLQ